MTDHMEPSTQEVNSTEDIPEPHITIKASVIPNINLALQQNAYPVLRDIEILNDTADQYAAGLRSITVGQFPPRISTLSPPNGRAVPVVA